MVLRHLPVSVFIFLSPGEEAHGPTSGIWGMQVSLMDETAAQWSVGEWWRPRDGSRKSNKPKGCSFSRVPKSWPTWGEVGSIISAASKPLHPCCGLVKQSRKEQTIGKISAASTNPSSLGSPTRFSTPLSSLHPQSQRHWGMNVSLGTFTYAPECFKWWFASGPGVGPDSLMLLKQLSQSTKLRTQKQSAAGIVGAVCQSVWKLLLIKATLITQSFAKVSLQEWCRETFKGAGCQSACGECYIEARDPAIFS